MKLLISSLFLLYIFSNSFSQTWLYNNPNWVYKFDNIENKAGAQYCVDGKMNTYTRNNWGQPDDIWYLPASIYFDLGKMRYLKDFRINCMDEFPFCTVDNIQLYYSNTPDGPWEAALTATMPEAYSPKASWYQFAFDPQTAQYWKLTVKPRHKAVALFEIGFGTAGVPYAVSIPDTIIAINQPMEIPIYSSIIKTSNNVVSYQMRVNYDASMLEYTDFSLNNTIAKGGAITINNSIQGALIISYMGTTPLNGMGPIIKLIFEPQQLGKSDIMIFDCLYNVDTIPKLKNGSITIDGIYGDIDQNNAVQAFDASAVLQYSVGLDPLDFDEIPWDPWRIVLANVDGREGVSANDASLILQYSSGSISTYPIEAIHQIDQSFADVLVRQTNNELVFSSTGKLYGLNVKMISVENLELGLPIMSYENMLSTTNIQGETYNIGLCSATPLQDNTTIMKIPFKMTGHSEASAEIEMIVNRNATSKIMIFFLKNQ